MNRLLTFYKPIKTDQQNIWPDTILFNNEFKYAVCDNPGTQNKIKTFLKSQNVFVLDQNSSIEEIKSVVKQLIELNGSKPPNPFKRNTSFSESDYLAAKRNKLFKTEEERLVCYRSFYNQSSTRAVQDWLKNKKKINISQSTINRILNRVRKRLEDHRRLKKLERYKPTSHFYSRLKRPK